MKLLFCGHEFNNELIYSNIRVTRSFNLIMTNG